MKSAWGLQDHAPTHDSEDCQHFIQDLGSLIIPSGVPLSRAKQAQAVAG